MGNGGLDQSRQGLEVSGNKEEGAHPSCILKQYAGWGLRWVGSARCGESLDCIDPFEARFSLQVKLDMEKIMEKLGGLFK